MGVKILLRAQAARTPPGAGGAGGTGPAGAGGAGAGGAAPGPASSQAQEQLLRRLVDEVMSCSPRSEVWAVTCTLLKQGHGLVAGGAAAAAAGGAAPAPPLRDMWAVTFRDLPDYMYLLQRQDHKALECDAATSRLLERKLEYTKHMTVRLEGHTYSKGDFMLRLCTATQALHSTQAFLGHCLEVEYTPVSTIAVAEGMMAEFVDLLRQTLAGLAGGGQGAGGGGQGAGGGLERQGSSVAAGGGGGGAAAGAGPALTLEIVRPSYDKYGLGPAPYGRTHAAIAYTDMVVTWLGANSAAATAAAAAAAAAAAGAAAAQPAAGGQPTVAAAAAVPPRQ